MDPIKKKMIMRTAYREHADALVTEFTTKTDKKSTTALVAIKKCLEDKVAEIRVLDGDILNSVEDDQGIAKELKESLNYSDRMTTIVATIDGHLMKIQSFGGRLPSINGDEPKPDKTRSKLPKLEVPSFSGEILAFRGFWDQFNAAIHQRTDLEDIEKFSYLKSLLKEKASDLVSGISLSATNYAKAVELLFDRFGNTQSLIAAHMDKLVKIPKVHDISDVKSMRTVYDTLETHIRNLSDLAVDSTTYGTLLISIIFERIPDELRVIISREFKNETWVLKDLMKIFKDELYARERCAAVNMSGSSSEDQFNGSEPFTAQSLQFSTKKKEKSWNKPRKCVYCNSSNHIPSRCSVVSDSKARLDILKRNSLCFVCLKSSHRAYKCKTEYKCVKCGSRHHVSICDKSNERDNTDEKKPDDKRFGEKQLHGMQIQSGAQGRDNDVILQSAMGEISNPDNSKKCSSGRLLFDACSQRTYITDDMRKRLGLKTIRTENVIIKRFASEEGVMKTLDVVTVCCHGKIKDVKVYLQALCVPLICSPLDNPRLSLVKEKYNYLENLQLADTNISGEDSLNIDILVGLDYYYALITGKIIKGLPSKPVAVESLLGWIICGNVQVNEAKQNVSITQIVKTTTAFNECDVSSNSEQSNVDILHDDLKRFWEVESVGINSPADVYEHFKNNIVHDGNRYVTKLPFKPHCETLPDNYKLCVTRLKYLLRRLDKNEALKSEYSKIIEDYEKSGIVERVTDSGTPGNVHYLPHREVVREDKDTTKVRIVLDASAKGAGPSLNDCLYAGPCLISSIFKILLRFRVFSLGLLADIQQAFLNVGIHEEHRNFLRFLWQENNELVIFRFTVAIFGAKSSSFLLNGTIDCHMENYVDETKNLEENKKLVEKFMDSLYIDDTITGVDSHEEGITTYKFSKKALQAAGFNLRKWYSNSAELTNAIKQLESVNESPDAEAAPESTSEEKKVLGIIWNTDDDLVFDFQQIADEGLSTQVTKRRILSISAKFYDPLGLISPIIIFFKVLFQELCRNGCSWDEVLSDELKLKWTGYLEKLREIKFIEVPRFVFSKDFSSKKVSLHGFCDASLLGYAAAVYIRSEVAGGIHVCLLSSKTKVSPMHPDTLTIPRLELLSCVLLSDLISVIHDSLKNYVNITDLKYWTDSEIALAWIKGCSKEWKPWVENRVNKIRGKTTVSEWRHVPGVLNPADVPTRKVEPATFSSNRTWWNGPEFLYENTNSWPPQDIRTSFDSAEITKEIRKSRKEDDRETSTSLCNITETEKLDRKNLKSYISPEKYSSPEKLWRITSYVMRFKNNFCHAKLGTQRRAGALTVEEIKISKLMWIKCEQSEIYAYKNYPNLKKQLGLFSDEEGILRLRGRFRNADWGDARKYPILLPRNSHLTKLIIWKAHDDVKHAGIPSTLNQLRNEFWICSGRQVIRNILRKCVTCKKVQGKPPKGPPPPDLPAFRVASDLAFSKVGIDYAGPVYVKNVYGEMPNMYKAYICLFTCATTRNLHLELVPDMGTEALIRCLKRFMARRGTLHTVVSDNFKTFMSQGLKDFLLKQNIQWTFILEKSPWWGGFYERMVRIIKDSMRKTLGNARLTYEEFETLLFEIEMAANSRPLTYLYDDPIEALTPSHLSIGRRLMNSMVNVDIEEDCDSTPLLHKRQKHLNAVLSHYWKRFHTEYLNQLREKHCYVKGKYDVNKLVVGDVVLIKDDDNFTRNKWKQGVIDELIAGEDGNVRGAALRTYTNGKISSLRRPVQKLVPLEVTRDESDNTNATSTEVVNDSNNVTSCDTAVENEDVCNTDKTDKIVIENENVRKRPKRSAAIAGELQRRLANQE